jgi:hypothetical protein
MKVNTSPNNRVTIIRETVEPEFLGSRLWEFQSIYWELIAIIANVFRVRNVGRTVLPSP